MRQSYLLSSSTAAFFIFSGSMGVPSISEAVSGARGFSRQYGTICVTGSSMRAALLRDMPSGGMSTSPSLMHPVSTGFIAPTHRPSVPMTFMRAQATSVLPTPVSVPVMKKPLGMSNDIGLSFNYSRDGRSDIFPSVIPAKAGIHLSKKDPGQAGE